MVNEKQKWELIEIFHNIFLQIFHSLYIIYVELVIITASWMWTLLDSQGFLDIYRGHVS